MRAIWAVSLVAISSVMGVSSAIAQSYSSPWIFSVNVGTQIPSSGNVVQASTSSLVALSTLNTNLTGNGTMIMRGRTFDDMYDNALTASVEVRYALSDLTELFGSLGYRSANAKTGVTLGCLEQTTAPGTCYQAITGEVDDLQQYSLEIGYRQWLGMGLLSSAIKPYWAVHGGAVYTDAINIHATTPAGGIGNWTLYDDGWSVTAAADVGASYTLSSNFEIAAELGVRYTDKLKDNDTDFTGLSMQSINDKSREVSFPVSVRMHTVF